MSPNPVRSASRRDGAVAGDRHGRHAAAASTGGMTGETPGRAGDCPIIGAGTCADGGSCAVSAAGHGEFFTRYGIAFGIAARPRQAGPPRQQAVAAVIDEQAGFGGNGGVIAVDRAGAPALPFNTAGMHRGYTPEGERLYT